jgi:hypothetical protein
VRWRRLAPGLGEERAEICDEFRSPATKSLYLKTQNWDTWGGERFRVLREPSAWVSCKALRDNASSSCRSNATAIADTTGDRPNVMYELGRAHAHEKPVVLLRCAGPAEVDSPPFDPRTESVILLQRRHDRFARPRRAHKHCNTFIEVSAEDRL